MRDSLPDSRSGEGESESADIEGILDVVGTFPVGDSIIEEVLRCGNGYGSPSLLQPRKMANILLKFRRDITIQDVFSRVEHLPTGKQRGRSAGLGNTTIKWDG